MTRGGIKNSDNGDLPDFSLLDDLHFDVLNGVEQLKNSKEIARDLGISPHTVDQRLKRVQSLLGVSSRFEAARIYRENRLHADESVSDQSLVYQSPALPAAPEYPQTRSSPGEWNPAEDNGTFSAHEAQAAYFAGEEGGKFIQFPFSVLWENSRRNEMSFARRALAISILMIISIVIFAVLVGIAENLSKFY
ncbi:MAG: helix-turn-helix transcriptional regulator [Sphingorhabdus sp.]